MRFPNACWQVVRSNALIWLVWVLVFAFSSCSYTYSDDYFNTLERPDPGSVTIALLNFQQLDTINEVRNFQFTITGDPGITVVETRVTLNAVQLSSEWDAGTGTFTVDPTRYSDGVQNISIQASYRPGNGSLADQLGLESYTKTENFRFTINRLPSDPPAVTGVQIVDGSIQVQWENPEGSDYDEAFLYLRFKTREHRFPLSEAMLQAREFTDNLTVLFTGNSNVPDFDEYQTVTYQIQYVSEFGDQFGEGQSLTEDPSWFDMAFVFSGLDRIGASWPAHPLYGNFDAFQMSLEGTPFEGDSNGGTFDTEGEFVVGKPYWASGRPIVRNTYQFLPRYQFFGLEYDTTSGSFGVFQMDDLFVKEFLYHPITDRYYALVIEERTTNGYTAFVYEYDTDFNFMAKGFIAESQAVRHEYIRMDLDPAQPLIYVDTNYGTYAVDPSTLGVVQAFSDASNYVSRILRGDILKYWDQEAGILRLEHLPTGATIFEGMADDFGFLSADGQFLVLRENAQYRVYRVFADRIEALTDLPPVVYDFNKREYTLEFQGDQVACAINGQLLVKDLITMGEVTVPFGTTQQALQWDPISGYIVITQSDSSLTFDPVSGTFVRFRWDHTKNAQGPLNSEDRDYQLWLQNGNLIHSSGLYFIYP